MELYVIRMVAAAVQNAQYGVNAQLAGIPLEAGDLAVPAVVTFLDGTRDDRAARRTIADLDDAQLPLLMVSLASDADLKGVAMTTFQEGSVSIVLTYVSREPVSARGAQACFYTLQAIRKFLNDFLSNERSADRQRSNVEIINCSSMRDLRPQAEQSDTLHQAHLVVTFDDVRDNAP